MYVRLEYMSYEGFFEARNLLNFYLSAIRILNMQNWIIIYIKFYLDIIFVHKSQILRFKKAFLAHILRSRIIILLIYGHKIIIFIFIYIYKWGKESSILLAEKIFFSKKSPKWCPGVIAITYKILSRFIYHEMV